MALQPDQFERDRITDRQKRDEELDELEHQTFLNSARIVGFTDNQAEFQWQNYFKLLIRIRAQEKHQHLENMKF